MKAIMKLVLISFLIANVPSVKGEDSYVSVAYLKRPPDLNKICLHIATGWISDGGGSGVIINGSLEVFSLSKLMLTCDSTDITSLLQRPLIILPEAYDNDCYSTNSCKAAVVLRNEKVLHDNCACYDVLIGNFFHERKDADKMHGFQVTDIIPYRLTCSRELIHTLLTSNKMERAVKDIWSPIEEIANDAVAKVSAIGADFVKQLTDQINSMQAVIVDQTNVISNLVQQNADALAKNLNQNFGQLAGAIEKVEKYAEDDAGLVERYFHICMRIVEVVGTLAILYFCYQVYKRAKTFYDFFKWIGGHLWPTHRHPKPRAVNNLNT